MSEAKEMSVQDAADWLVGKQILGVEYQGDSLLLVFEKGHVEISGDDYEVYVETN